MSLALMLAPLSSRTVTVSVSPFALACIRAVQPFYRGQEWSGRQRLKPRAVLRYAYVVCSLDVGLSVHQDRHGVRLTIVTGHQQGRPTIL
jgi:hypothetical protein